MKRKKCQTVRSQYSDEFLLIKTWFPTTIWNTEINQSYILEQSITHRLPCILIQSWVIESNKPGVSYQKLKDRGFPDEGIYELYKIYKIVLGENKQLIPKYVQKISLTSIIRSKSSEKLLV
jgi:hypothetical protein